MIAFEFFNHVLAKRMDQPEIGFFNPYGNPTVLNPKITPTHYTTEGGGTYSSRPDLTRAGGPGTYMAAGALALTLGSVYGSAVINEGYFHVIKEETPDVQASMWRSFSQSLTGGFGVGTGLNL